MKKDQEISKLVARLNREAAARDAEAAEVANLQGSLDALRPAYESRGDANKIYEEMLTSQKKELRSMQNAYDSTRTDLEQCLSSANRVDSAEAKQVLEAVEESIVAKGYGGPLDEIAGAIKDAMEQALGPQLGNSGDMSGVPVMKTDTAVDATQDIFQKLKDTVDRTGEASGIVSSSTETEKRVPDVPTHWQSEPEALAADFQRLMSKLRRTPQPEATPRPLQNKLADSWNHVAQSREIKEKSVQLPDALGEKVRTLVSE